MCEARWPAIAGQEGRLRKRRRPGLGPGERPGVKGARGMRETKQILDAIFAKSGYTLEDYLKDVGIRRAREEGSHVGQRLLTGRQACEYLQVSATTLWRLTKRGGLKTVQVRGRTQYDVRELDRFIRRHSK